MLDKAIEIIEDRIKNRIKLDENNILIKCEVAQLEFVLNRIKELKENK